MNAYPTRYTLVQHSGYFRARDFQFRLAVEFAVIPNERAEQRVVGAGGVVFEDYESAQKAEYDANYPPGTEGIVPHVRGSFSKNTLSTKGPRIYVPAREMVHV